MPHATHNARRMGTSQVPDAPTRRSRSPFERQVLMTVAVSFTMLIIVSLYAVSFRSRQDVRAVNADMPRWTMLDDSLIGRVQPIKDELANIKMTLSRLAGAGKTQAAAAAILKAKIEARNSASGTPETSETPVTP